MCLGFCLQARRSGNAIAANPEVRELSPNGATSSFLNGHLSSPQISPPLSSPHRQHRKVSNVPFSGSTPPSAQQAAVDRSPNQSGLSPAKITEKGSGTMSARKSKAAELRAKLLESLEDKTRS